MDNLSRIEMAKEQARITKELFEVADCLAKTGVNIVLSVGLYQQGQRAQFKTRVSCERNHHVLDLVREIVDSWSEANHEKKDSEPCK